MKNTFFILTLLLICGSLKAEDGQYAVSKIAPALLVNANAVKRMENYRFTVVNRKRSVIYYKIAWTILNEKGEKFADCVEGYDKLKSINYIEGTLYDANGKKVKSVKK